PRRPRNRPVVANETRQVIRTPGNGLDIGIPRVPARRDKSVCRGYCHAPRSTPCARHAPPRAVGAVPCFARRVRPFRRRLLMIHRKTMLSASIMAALMFAASAQAQNAATQDVQAAGTPSQSAVPAQQAAEPPPDTGEQGKKRKRTIQELQAVQVVGSSASLQQSLQIKRSANAIVDGVTYEDLRK